MSRIVVGEHVRFLTLPRQPEPELAARRREFCIRWLTGETVTRDRVAIPQTGRLCGSDEASMPISCFDRI
ncbi:MAG: hypothetical protein JXA58_06940, partial [Dehalococcoidia bacterium]|nr:hypothetical protein [Dehalococcoidia bacterium]